jgi:hypothetical protein
MKPEVEFTNSNKKIALCAIKKINILTLVLSEEKFLNEPKNHTPPPFKLNGRSLNEKDILNVWTFYKKEMYI